METTIRVATPGDAAAVHLMIRGLAGHEGEADAVVVTPEVLADQMAWRQPPFECLLAERNGRPVGLSLFYPYYWTWQGDPGIHLAALFVVEGERRSGVGTALLERLAAIAVERGCGALEFAALNSNEMAAAFSDRLGASGTSDSTLYLIAGEALERLATTET
jgi:GNAT superfamily N-acetyltransferase